MRAAIGRAGPTPSVPQVVLGATGLAVTTYGLWLLLRRTADLPAVLVWLGSGVVLHDAVLIPVVLLLCLAGRRLLPRPWWIPMLMALVVTGSLTLMAVPVLGRFGARPDNPTLLDRPYLAAWAGLLGLTAVLVVLGARVAARRSGAGPPAADADDRDPGAVPPRSADGPPHG